jgi:predicted hotdog family 3-hydroxylacyl-ACP dehydratase
MRIEHQDLCGLIPHDGDMCLLETVEYWDEKRIVCTSRSHQRTDNPLRSDDRLAAIHGVEYAAQAMAVHGGLLAREKGETNPGGYLAALRGVSLHVERLDSISESLHIEAEELMRNGGNFIYQFLVQAEGKTLLDGRLTVMAQEAV